MDVISAEAHAGCWGTALPPENRVREWSSAGGKELMIWRCGEKRRTSKERDPQIEEENVEEINECQIFSSARAITSRESRSSVSSESIMQMAGLPPLPGCARLQKQSPFIRLPAMSTWVEPLESVHHHEVWMCLWIWEKHIRPAASVHISGHMHHCKCLGGFLFCFFLFPWQ